MTESTENVRKDAGVREDKQKQVTDWGGRRFVLPKGTTLPAITDDLIEGEVFIKVRAGASDQLYIFDKGINNWTTVGPG